MTKGSDLLNYVFVKRLNATQDQQTFSLDPEKSDFWHNQSLLNSFVGTLVKYGPSGRLEPYLAKQFHVSEDGKTWTFQLRPNITCENGSPITAKSFHQQLLQQLKNYANNGSVITFDSLLGWDDFVGGKSDGLQGFQSTSSEELVFRFAHKPEDFLELLRMVYFGYWCKEGSKVISSGAYSLGEYDATKPTEAKVQIRRDWFSVGQGVNSGIRFLFASAEEALSYRHHSIVHFGLRDLPEGYEEHFALLTGAPTILRAMVLSPFKEGPFKIPSNRQLFAQKIRDSKLAFPIRGVKKSQSFYLTSSPTEFPSSVTANYVGIKPGTKVTVIGPTSPNDVEGRYFRALIEEALSGSGIAIEYVTDPKAYSDKEIMSNKAVDIRIDSVDIGAGFLNFATKMMFCTQMGIAFPDPSKRICELVSEYERADKLPDHDYAERFNKILAEDASVIPIAHRTLNWLVSKDIDLSSLPPVVTHPQFEKIQFLEP